MALNFGQNLFAGGLFERPKLIYNFGGVQLDTVVPDSSGSYRISGGGTAGTIQQIGIIMQPGFLRNLRVHVGENSVDGTVRVIALYEGFPSPVLFVTYAGGETGSKKNIKDEVLVPTGLRIGLAIQVIGLGGTTVSQVSWSCEYHPLE